MTIIPRIMPATLNDLPQITDIYNHYIESSAITFDIKPWTWEERLPWFKQFEEGFFWGFGSQSHRVIGD